MGKSTHPNRHLQSAWHKYGGSAFFFEPLLICSKENLLLYEQRAIDVHRSNDGIYNLAPRAGSQIGFRHSDETREGLSRMKTGLKHSPEHRASISAALQGHAVSQRHRTSFIARITGRSPTAETRAKMSAAKLGKKQRPEHVARRAASNTGKKRSAETCRRIAEGLARHYMVQP